MPSGLGLCDVLNLTYEDTAGSVYWELVYRTSEPGLNRDGDGRPWSLDADPHLFMLVSEVERIEFDIPLRPVPRCRDVRR